MIALKCHWNRTQHVQPEGISKSIVFELRSKVDILFFSSFFSENAEKKRSVHLRCMRKEIFKPRTFSCALQITSKSKPFFTLRFVSTNLSHQERFNKTHESRPFEDPNIRLQYLHTQSFLEKGFEETHAASWRQDSLRNLSQVRRRYEAAFK